MKINFHFLPLVFLLGAGNAQSQGIIKTKAKPGSASRAVSKDTPARNSLVESMANQVTFLVQDFKGEEHQRPDMGCELSDFGSWYDVAYSGGVNRFWLNSVRHQSYNQVGFNATQDVGMVSLFFKTNANKIIDGSGGKSTVKWYPYGWRTTTEQDQVRIESTTFFSAFNTVVIYTKVKNLGTKSLTLTPSVLLTGRSEYDGLTGGRIVARTTENKQLSWQNSRIGKESKPEEYTDALLIGSDLGPLQASFLPEYVKSGRGQEISAALTKAGQTAVEAKVGAAIASTKPLKIAPGKTSEFAFYIAAGPDNSAAAKTLASVQQDVSANGIKNVFTRLETDWNTYLQTLPKLVNPSREELMLYYSSALALRTNRAIMSAPAKISERVSSHGSDLYQVANTGGKGVLYNVSCPARGGFNLFLQSDACWNLLGYLDINSNWAVGHAVPILEPTCIIMDPHFFWSMWELYSRLPDAAQQKAFAAKIYPLLKENYKVWTTQVDIDHNLLCSTPNNWDDSPRADLLFKEAKDVPGQWNSWWSDWVNFSRDRYLEDPSASSQLAYGTVVMERLATILGNEKEAAEWNAQFKKHVEAVNTLWDEEHGYWIVTYKHSLKDYVLTSSILYPIFTDVCRDTAKIRRVIETHILNPKEFNGEYPIPTVAYNDSRYYTQKAPHTDQEGGLWRGHIWLPEAWLIVKGLYKYGYEREAQNITRRLTVMMAKQEKWTQKNPQFAHVPAEYYDSRTGEGQNIRRYAWTCAVAMDFQLGNYQNERMLGTNSARDRAISGHIREVYDFASGKGIFRVKTTKSVFPLLRMNSASSLPIEKSKEVVFSFNDPAGNFTNSSIAFYADPSRWLVKDKATGVVLKADNEGYCQANVGTELLLTSRK